MMVSGGAAKVTNLDADKVDGQDSTDFAQADHDHDSRYFTETEVDTAFSGKANTAHQHAGQGINSGMVEADFLEDGTGSNLNADQLDGRDSTFYLPGGNLPSGSTVRGAFGEADVADFTNQGQYAPISFGYSISFTPTIRYVAGGQLIPTGCTGGAANPGAQPGYLCIFEADYFNLNSRNPFMVGSSGAVVALSAASANTFYAYGNWALIAP